MEYPYSYTNTNGKKVSGASAMLHFIYTICGGIDKYNAFVCKNAMAEMESRKGLLVFFD